MRTHQANQWSADAFYEYVVRNLQEAKADYTPANVTAVYQAILTYSTMAGNAQCTC